MIRLEVIGRLSDENGRGLKEQVIELLAQGQVLSRARLRDSPAVNNE
jgi:hypothetical protein